MIQLLAVCAGAGRQSLTCPSPIFDHAPTAVSAQREIHSDERQLQPPDQGCDAGQVEVGRRVAVGRVRMRPTPPPEALREYQTVYGTRDSCAGGLPTC